MDDFSKNESSEDDYGKKAIKRLKETKEILEKLFQSVQVILFSTLENFLKERKTFVSPEKRN